MIFRFKGSNYYGAKKKLKKERRKQKLAIKSKEKERWHSYFAWIPTTIRTNGDSSSQKVWLQRILRRGEQRYKYLYLRTGHYWHWSYRLDTK